MFSTSACKALVCTALIAGLSACGGDEAPDPFLKYKEQSVEWTECDPTILGHWSFLLNVLPPTKQLRCTSIRAPLDWSNAERGEIAVSVMRLAAGMPEKRQGIMLFNPGGPGNDGLPLTLKLFRAFSGSNPDNPQGARQLRLLDEYDMIGFSPRGTGASTQLHCGTNELKRFVHTSAAEWDTPENIANIHYNESKTAEACHKNPITPYINSDATARDMELIRSLLGEEKLNYVGYSYGTWLGAWYASLFPEKVGRMVLDSSVDFTSAFEQTLPLDMVTARQRLFDEVMVPYAVRHADYFRLGATEAEVRSVMQDLSPRVQQALKNFLSSGYLFYGRDDSDEILRAIWAAQWLDGALKTVSDPADLKAVEEMLDHYVFDASDEASNINLRFKVLRLLWAYAELWVNPIPRSIFLAPSTAVNTAVRCNDSVATTDLTEWTEKTRSKARHAPMFFEIMVDVSCAQWGGPKVSKPDWAPMKPLDVLFVQSQYDAATNADGANAFFTQLPGARRVFVSRDHQHGVYPYLDSCVDPLVTGYLLGEPVTQRETICPGHPLPQDAKTPDVQQKSATASEGKVDVPPVYKDPKRARELIDEFKRGLIPPNL